MSEAEEEYDYQREPEPDAQTLHVHSNRSRYFFAMMSFLVALLFLSIYLNNYYDLISGWLILLGAFVFGGVGVFFLRPNSLSNRTINTSRDYQSSKNEKSMMEVDDEESMDKDGNTNEDELSPFERLVKEALTSIPAEFQEQMENVLVRVQYEPCEEVMKRVGIK